MLQLPLAAFSIGLCVTSYATGRPSTSFLTNVPVPGLHCIDGSSTAPSNVQVTGGGFSIQMMSTFWMKTFSHFASLRHSRKHCCSVSALSPSDRLLDL